MRHHLSFPVLLLFLPVPLTAQVVEECVVGYFENAFNHRNTRPGGQPYRYSVTAAQWANADNDPIWYGNIRAMHMCLIPKPPLQGAVLVWDGNEINNPDGTQFWSVMRPELDDTNQDKFWNFELKYPQIPKTEGRDGDFGCSGHSWMSDGRLFNAAGTSQVKNPGGQVEVRGTWFCFIFDPGITPGGTPVGSNMWTRTPDMLLERWYPSVTHVWENGQNQERMLVTGGRDKNVIYTNTKYDTYETWNPTTGAGSWATWGANNTRDFRGPETAISLHYLHLYPRLHLLSNGQVFRSGMTPHGAVLAHTDGTNSPDAQWSARGQTTPSTFKRWYGASVLFPNIDPKHTNAVMILGGLDPSTGTYLETAQICKASTSNSVGDFNSTPQGYNWANLPKMTHKREFPDAVIMPNGSILVFGGNKDGNNIWPTSYTYTTEQYKGRSVG